jgi:hypothetical protein
LGVLSNGPHVVETDLTTFYHLANLRGGAIEFQLDLQLLESIYLRAEADETLRTLKDRALLGGVGVKQVVLSDLCSHRLAPLQPHPRTHPEPSLSHPEAYGRRGAPPKA